MVNFIFQLLPPALVWGTLPITTRRYLRNHADPSISAWWQAQIAMAIALTVDVQYWSPAIDHWLGLPNAMRWLSNVAGLYVIVCVFRMFNTLLNGKKRHHEDERPVFWSWLIASGALAVCLWAANVPDLVDIVAYGNPALIAYRIVYLTFFAGVLIRLTLMARRLASAASDLIVYLSLEGFGIGSYWAFAYCGATLALDLMPRHYGVLSLVSFADHLCICVAAITYIGTYSLYAWAKHVHLIRFIRQARLLLSYYRLQPLWQRLHHSVAAPMAFHLTPPLLAVIRRPEQCLFLIDRVVIEILDDLRILGIAIQTEDSAELIGSGTNLTELPTQLAMRSNPLPAMRETARMEAATLAYRIYRDPLALKQSAQQLLYAPYRPKTYIDLVLYLEQVALAFRMWTWRYWLSGEALKQWYTHHRHLLPWRA